MRRENKLLVDKIAELTRELVALKGDDAEQIKRMSSPIPLLAGAPDSG